MTWHTEKGFCPGTTAKEAPRASSCCRKCGTQVRAGLPPDPDTSLEHLHLPGVHGRELSTCSVWAWTPIPGVPQALGGSPAEHGNTWGFATFTPVSGHEPAQQGCPLVSCPWGCWEESLDTVVSFTSFSAGTAGVAAGLWETPFFLSKLCTC